MTDQPSDGRPPVSNDALEHLWTAAHELLTAMRKLVDAADEFVADQMQGRARESEAQPHVQRIDIDVDTP